jgi:hypothetical protein
MSDINSGYESAMWDAIQDEWIAKIPRDQAEYVTALLIAEMRIHPDLRNGLVDRIAEQFGLSEMRLLPVHEAAARLCALQRGQSVSGADEHALRALLYACGGADKMRRAAVLMVALPGVLHRARLRCARPH